jgi:TM2 domain-containing membrane protein YozV
VRSTYSQRVTTDPTEPEYGYTRPEYPQPGYPYAGYVPQDYPPPPGFAPVGMPYPQAWGVDAWGRPLSDKSKVTAGILGLLLGGFGAGRFYIGDNRTAVWQLIVTFFTCGIGHLWGMIDGILILVNGGVDAQGRVLRD